LRPEHLQPDADGPLRGTVALIERLGAESYVHLNVPGLAQPLVVALRGDPPPEDGPWAVRPAAGQIHVFDQQGARVDPAQPGAIKEVA
jgi:multiple sugar transport system ATP-binding protein